MDGHWTVSYNRKAAREIARLPESVRKRFPRALQKILNDPFSGKKLRGYANTYRLRFAESYRIVYVIDRKTRQLGIEYVGDRKDIYRRL